MDSRIDGLPGSAIAAFLEQPLNDMRATSPLKGKHALDLGGPRQPMVKL